MRMLLPIAGIGINIWLVVIIGATVGLLSGLLGVGGGFLLTPALMMIGVPPTVAAASGTNAIVAASTSGCAAHFRMRNVDLRMGAILLFGGLAGSGVGVYLVRFLRDLGNADLVITLTYVIVLGLVGGYIVRDSLKKMRKGIVVAATLARRRSGKFFAGLPLQMEFPHSGVRHSVLLPFVFCLMVGLLTAVMGVAGGFMVVPVMVYGLRMPAHIAVGTSLFQALFTCAGATFLQAGTNHTVDIVLTLLVAAGSTIGAQVGARLSRFLRAEQLMILLGFLALAVMVKMVVGLVVPPSVSVSEVAGLRLLQPSQQLAAWLVDLVRRLSMG